MGLLPPSDLKNNPVEGIASNITAGSALSSALPAQFIESVCSSLRGSIQEALPDFEAEVLRLGLQLLVRDGLEDLAP